jgi:hypothetical protein
MFEKNGQGKGYSSLPFRIPTEDLHLLGTDRRAKSRHWV